MSKFHQAILVYDVTNRASFTAVERWHEELLNYCQRECVIFLVANKVSVIPSHLFSASTSPAEFIWVIERSAATGGINQGRASDG